MTEFINFTRLEGRGRIEISDTAGGVDASMAFLQGLITNDIEKLKRAGMLYACFLTPQGKFLHDFFIHEDNGKIILDCEGGARAQDLYKRLVQYRLRKPVKIDVFEKSSVFATFEKAENTHKDPRHPEMGYRLYQKPEGNEVPFDEWDTKRISLCIPDGSRDLVPEKSTMDEARMDQLNAIDYQKGCYVGQELTARMHYRGLGKKHLAVVDVNALPEKAELRSSCGDIGLALVRDVS